MNRGPRLLAACAPLALVVALAGCWLHPGPVTPPRPPSAVETCEAFCEVLTHLGCPGHEGSPGEDEVLGNADDVACPRVCRDTLASGIYTSDRGCLDTAHTCEAAEVCVFDGGQP